MADLQYYGPAATNTNGVLNAFVQQPISNTPAETTNGIQYTEKWKGPYEKGKTVLSSVKVGDNLSVFHTWLGANRVVRIQPPTPPTRNNVTGNWLITSIRVDEHTAGDHCFINIETIANYGGSDVETLTEITDANTWSINWQSYSVTPYEFASGEVHSPLYVSEGNGPDDGNWSLPASRQMIEEYQRHNNKIISNWGGRNINPPAYCWSYMAECPEALQQLSPAEGELLKKINQGRNATYHYPIVIHSTSFIGNATAAFTEELGTSLDKKTTLPSDCPYKFAKIKVGNSEVDWTWIKIGDDMSQTKTGATTRFDRREVWAGYTDVDENYYGTTDFSHTEQGITKGRWYKNCL